MASRFDVVIDQNFLSCNFLQLSTLLGLGL